MDSHLSRGDGCELQRERLDVVLSFRDAADRDEVQPAIRVASEDQGRTTMDALRLELAAEQDRYGLAIEPYRDEVLLGPRPDELEALPHLMSMRRTTYVRPGTTGNPTGVRVICFWSLRTRMRFSFSYCCNG